MTAETPPAAPRKRAPRHYCGWTERALEGFCRKQAQFPPEAFCTFKYLAPPTGGAYLREEMQTLDKAIRNACGRYRYSAAWGLFIESGRTAGFHFHAWFASLPSGELMEFLQWHWLRRREQPDNRRKVFHYTGKARDVARMADYLAKEWKGRWKAKRIFDLWGLHGHWKPFHFHPGTRSKKAAGSTSQGFSCGAFQMAQKAAHPIPEAGSSGTKENASAPHVHLLLHVENPMRETPAPTGPAAVRIGVRIAPLYGPGDALIPPDAAWSAVHIARLSARWKVDAVTTPPWPPHSVEVMFLIPPGEVREFERAGSPSDGFARIIRP